MNKPHKHADLIHSWADGAEIQVLGIDGWEDTNPLWHLHNEYRIKPRTVKREGWAVIYKYNDGSPYVNSKIFVSEYDAKHNCPMATAIIKLEWTEEVE